MHLKDADGMANTADPDQTAPKEQSNLGQNCLLRSICPNSHFYANDRLIGYRNKRLIKHNGYAINTIKD